MPSKARTAIVVLLIIGLPAVVPSAYAAAQSAFDAVSIKVNKSGPQWDPRERRPYQPGGRVMMSFVSLRDLISNAYRLDVIGGPAWIDTERYDVVATAGRDGSVNELRAMLRTMFADRFKLVTHVEQRPINGLALTFAREGRPGPRLRTSSCTTLAQQMDTPLSSTNSPTGAEPVDDRQCGLMSLGAGQLMFRGLAMAQIAERLSAPAGLMVADRTGVTGAFDVDLEWTPDLPGAATIPDGPGFITALQEQLGLKLTAASVSHDIVVVDSAQHPTEN